MQRARFFFAGDIHFRRRLSQLSSRISARLPQRRETVAVGPDQVVDLDLVEARVDDRFTARSARSNSGQRGAAARFPEYARVSASLSFEDFQDFLDRAPTAGGDQSSPSSFAKLRRDKRLRLASRRD